MPEISEDEKPFELPAGWEWVRLGFITNYGECDKAEPTDADADTWIVELEDIEKSTSRLLNRVKFSERPFKSSKNKFNKNDVLYGKLRPYLDKVLIADDSGVCTTEIIPIKVYGNILPGYLRLLLKSPRFIAYANESTHGMNLPRLGTDKAINAVVELTAIAEQVRIVNKVDELMSLCDQLEQQSLTSLDAHQQLVETLLATLTDSQNAEELADNWARISHHFDTLFTTEASIDALKQTILQLAVMGKLVQQDPNDEPASELLKRIEQEKAKLVKEGKIKKQKPLPLISEDEKPFELPKGWEWCRIGNVINIRAELVKPENYCEFFQVAPDIIEKGTGKVISKRTVKESGIKGPNSRFYKNQIVYSKIRPSLSKAFIAEYDGLCSADMYPLDCFINTGYLLKVILSEVFLIQVRAAENRIKMPKLNVESLSNILIPVPPAGIQSAVFTKISQMDTFCDTLKSRLQSAQQTQLHLADALTDAALN